MRTKWTALLLAFALLGTLLVGCSGAESTPETSADVASAPEAMETEAPVESTPAPTAEVSAAEPEVPAVTISYPLEGDDLSLSLFTSFPGNLTAYMESFDDHPGFQRAQEATGVRIDFNAASMENAATQFDLMVASDSFNDLVCGFDDLYVGGLTAAYEGELIYDLNEYLADNAPDYLSLVDSNTDYQDVVYEADGTMLSVYGLYQYDYISVTNGILIRQDWLDDLNLDTPVTYDDWYETLTAFRNEKGAEAGLLLPNGSESRGATYAGGYETAGYSSDARMSAQHFFQKDGVVASSLLDDNYLDYLTMLHKWYEEGLIYRDFYSNETREIMDPLIYDNQVGIFDGKVDFITRYQEGDSTGTIRLAGIPNPVKKEGDTFGFGSYVTEKSSVAVTTACEDPELALQWLNYFFTEEGILLANYGIENVSFTYDGDTPVFTDLILHNEDPQLQFGNVTRLYLLDEVLPTIYDQTRELAAYNEAEQEAIATWSDSKEAVYTMPALILTTEENEEFSSILVDVETYASECIVKFIIGDMDLSAWGDFTDTLKDFGLERAIEIYQMALDAQAA